MSVLLSTVGFGGLVYAMTSLSKAGGGPVSPWISLSVGLLDVVAFVARQQKLRRSGTVLLDVRPLLDRQFAIATLALVCAMGALFGVLIVLPLYAQGVLGLSVLQTGLMLLPGGLVMGLVAPAVGAVFDRYGPRPLVIPGAVLLLASLAGLSLVESTTSVAYVIGAHIGVMSSLGLLVTPLMTSALGSVTSDLTSHASALLNTLQQLAGAAGTAVFVSVMSSGDGSASAESAGRAFMAGGVIAAVALVAALLVRRGEVAPSLVLVH